MFKMLAFFLIFVPGTIFAGPFGIEMGASADELDVSEKQNKASLLSVPQPHPLFEKYSVWQTDTLGVCRILAISKIYEDDAYGSGVRSDMERVEQALTKKYGSGDKLDSIRSSALWDGDREWVMSIKQNERIYAFTWNHVSAENEKYSLIQLWADAQNSDSALMILEYRASFFDACNSEIENSVDQNF